LAVRVLEVTEYPPTGHGHNTFVFALPTWEQIEAAVRALDHHRLPFFFIGLRERCEGEDCFSVLGGPNGYAISAADEHSGWLNYCDPLHTGGEVPVWTSDEGYYAEERYGA